MTDGDKGVLAAGQVVGSFGEGGLGSEEAAGGHILELKTHCKYKADSILLAGGHFFFTFPPKPLSPEAGLSVDHKLNA